MSTSDKIRPASQRRAAPREPCMADAARARARAAGGGGFGASVRPMLGSCGALALCTSNTCRCSYAAHDSVVVRVQEPRLGPPVRSAGVGSADIGGGPRVIWHRVFRLDHPQLASKKRTVKNGDGRAGRGRGGFATPVLFLRVVTTGWPRRLAECARRDDWRTSLMCLRDVTTRWLARDDAKCTPRPTPPR